MAKYALLGLLVVIAMTALSIPKGVRNNNPLNIRISDRNDWVGELPDILNKAQDSEFESFFTPISGFRAGAVLVRNYARRHSLNTIQGIITKWAPPNENNTAKYIEFVAGEMETSPAEPLNLEDNEVLTDLIFAMSKKENGWFIKKPSFWFSRSQAKAGVMQA